MGTYERHIMPQKCFISAHFCNGDRIHTSVNPELSDDELFKHYIGNTFTFASFDEHGRECEIKTKVVRMMITREEDQASDANQLPAPPAMISYWEASA